MARRKFQEFPTATPPSYPDQKAKELFLAILKLKDTKEAAKFFRDLLTLPEIEEFSNRWLAARLLAQGHSYAEVAEKTKMSTTTVARVAHWLHNGWGGYRLILDRLKPKTKLIKPSKLVFPR
jgi:TrpR-related protein YerC/YecD